MASQEFALPTGGIGQGSAGGSAYGWVLNADVDTALTDDGSARLADVSINFLNNTLQLNITGGDLSDAWETGGSVSFTKGDFTVTVEPNSRDRSEPYSFQQAGLWNAINTRGRTSGWTLTLDDGVSPAIRNIYRGGQQVQRIYRGNTEIIRVYRGGTQIFGEVPWTRSSI